MNKCIATLAVLLVFVSMFGQDKKAFKQLYLDAEPFFIDEYYDKAAPIYEQIITMGMGNAHIYFNLGFCYLNIPGEINNAIFYLDKAALDTKKNFNESSYKELQAPEDALFYLAKAYRLNNDFDNAIAQYNKFKALLDVTDIGNIEFVDLQIKSCETAKAMINDPVRVEKNILPATINTVEDEYCPAISADGNTLIYTSQQLVFDPDYGEELPFSFIFQSSRSENGEWIKPKEITTRLGSNGYYSSASLSADGFFLILYMNDFGNGDLFYSEFDGKKWSQAKPFPKIINSKHNETHGCVTEDKKTLFFTSNRPNGLGGLDIYKSIKNEKGEWGEPINLGNSINSVYDEETPWCSANGKTLYFSSEGHSSMGGFDVFQSTMINDVQWASPLNLGYPVNTSHTDWFFTPFGKNKAIMAYFDQAGIGKRDLYEYTLYERVPEIEPEEHLPDTTPTIPPQDTLVAQVPATEQPVLSQQEAEPVTNQTAVDSTPPALPSQSEPVVEQAPEPEPVPEPVRTNFKLNGKIILSDNAQPDQRFTIKIYSQNGILEKTLIPEENSGQFTATLPFGQYRITADGQGYQTKTENLFIPENYNRNEAELTLTLQTAEVASGEYVVVKSIFFDYGSSNLRRDAMIEIEKLFTVMQQNPSLYIEVTGHADALGAENINQTISVSRARSVVNYLCEKGIEPNRFVAKGSGSKNNIAINVNADGSDNPEGRQFNRRADLKIIRSNNDVLRFETVTVPGNLRPSRNYYYTVFLKQSSKMLNPSFFVPYKKDSIINVWTYPTATGYIYTVGQYRTKSKAVSILNKALDAGFAEAVIISDEDLNQMKQKAEEQKAKASMARVPDENTIYTIQLIALRNPVELTFFKNLENVKEFIGTDGIYRYYIGNHKGISAAREAKKQMAGQGYPDAFIMNLDRYKE